MRKLLLAIVITVITAASANANNLSFMKDISIKNSGMSGSMAPFASDSFAPFINPAGLGFTPTQEIRLMYYNLFADSVISSASYAYPILNGGTLALSGIILSTPEIEERDVYNQKTGTFEDTFRILSLSYGINVSSIFNIGASVKYINHEFYSYNKHTYGIDAGAIILLPSDLNISISAENIIKPEFGFDTATDKLPLSVSAAIGYKKSFSEDLKDSLLISTGITKEEFTNSIDYNAGAQYSLFDMLALRGGISSEGFSFGGSVMFAGAEFNYAYVNRALDFIHRFSVSYSFGENIRDIEEGLKTKEDKLKYELVNMIKGEAVIKLRKRINALLSTKQYEEAKETVVKGLIWVPKDSWFTEKEKEIDSILNSQKLKSLFADADKLMNQDMYIDALVVLRNILDIEPDNTEAKAKFTKAEEYIQKLGEKNFAKEEQNRKQIQEDFNKGLSYYSKKQYKKALAEWDKVIKNSPLQNQVYGFMKKAETKLRDKADQKKTIAQLKAYRIKETYNKAVLLYTQGEFEKSIEAWRKLLEMDPNNAEAKEYLDKITEEFRKLQRQNLGW